MITTKENWDKYVDSGDNKYLIEFNPEKVNKNDILVIYGEGWEIEVKVV